MKIPHTVQAKRLYFSEGIELGFSQFVELLKIKRSEIVIHIATANIVPLKEKHQSLSQFLNIEHGIFILDSTPMMFTDDRCMDDFSELLMKLKHLFKDESSTESIQNESHEEKDFDEDKQLSSPTYDLFRKIGDSLFGPHNISKISDPLNPNQQSDKNPVTEPLPNKEVEKVISLRRKIQHIEEKIHDPENPSEQKEELEQLLTSYRTKILEIINKQR